MEGEYLRRERTGNWTKLEVAVLSEECIKHSSLLHGAVGPNLTYEKKNRIWKEIIEKINSVGGGSTMRTTEQVKKKWGKM